MKAIYWLSLVWTLPQIAVISMVSYSWVMKVIRFLKKVTWLDICRKMLFACKHLTLAICVPHPSMADRGLGCHLFAMPLTCWQQRNNVSLWCILHTYFSQQIYHYETVGLPVEFAGEKATILNAEIHRLLCLIVHDCCYLTFGVSCHKKKCSVRWCISTHIWCISTHICCIESTAKKTRTTGL